MNFVKSIFLTVVMAFSAAVAFAQPMEPVTWSSSVEKISEGEYRVDFKASVADGWHMYDLGPYEGGPMATAFTFDPIEGYELVGEVKPSKESVREMNEIFEMVIGSYEGDVIFSQVIKAPEGAKVNGVVEWMACSDQCTNGEWEFSFNLGEVKPTAEVKEAATTSGSSIWGYILSAVGWALVALLTPCVFPMIPMTVGFLIGGSSSNKGGRLKGLIFGLSIVLIYTLLGLVVSLFQSTAATDAIGTHWIPNLIFALLFIVFAVSFLGAFEITLPNGLANKADQRADKGGYIAAFFVAVAMVIVSFSCTGPFVGSILAAAVMDGVALKPILGMAVFGAAFSLPFVLLSFFPGFMKKLPKSGGWLNVVKVVFAFVMLAFAMKFLYNIDAYFSWGIITRTGFLVIWITLALLLGMYFLGMYRTSHDSPCEGIGWVRMIAAIASFAFALYLVPGLFGAPLKTVSGLIPAMDDSVFSISNTSNGTNSESASGYSSIESYTNLDEAITISSQSHKPIFVSFKSHTCSVCKVMESTVLNDSEILSKLQNDFVVANLYVDDKTPNEEFKTLGRRYRNIEMTMFSSASQPLYAIIDASSNILAGPIGSCSKEEFLEFLNY